MAQSCGSPKPCDCGFDEDDLEFCANGIVYSDMFRKLVESPCNCICHGNVIAFRPKTPVVVREGLAELELVAA